MNVIGEIRHLTFHQLDHGVEDQRTTPHKCTQSKKSIPSAIRNKSVTFFKEPILFCRAEKCIPDHTKVVLFFLEIKVFLFLFF